MNHGFKSRGVHSLFALACTSLLAGAALAGVCDVTENDACGGIDPDPNGGCNFAPANYQDAGSVSFGSPITICGTVGTFGDASRDLDWYTITLDEPGVLQVSAVHSTSGGTPAPNFTIFIISGTDCDTQVTEFAAASGASPFVTPEVALPAGQHVLIFTVNAFAPDEPACPVDYESTVTITSQIPASCGTATGDCITPTAEPGCSLLGCCATVCAFNPLCCEVEWDSSCVELALDPGFCGLFVYECDAPQLDNDCATDATVLTLGAVDNPFSNINANTDGPPTDCVYGADVWYLVQLPDAEGELTVTLNTPDIDSTLALYAIGDSSTFDPQELPNFLIGCVDGFAAGGEGVVLVGTLPNEWILIQAAGFDGGAGAAEGTGTIDTAFSEVLFNTGGTNAIQWDPANGGNFTLTNLGLSSGNLNAANAQRWYTAAFTVPEGGNGWQVDSIHAYGFSPAGVTNQTLNYIIWERNGQDAPFDGGQVISGSVPFPTPIDLPEGNPANEDHLILTDFELCPGDYYLTVYAANDSGGTLAANFAWFISAPNGINLIDPPGPATGPFGWRSALFPTPGFVVYQLPPTQLQQNPDFDPNDLYNTGFRITGGEGKTPCTPSCPEDLDGSGTIDGGDLGIVLAAWGNTGGPEDLDGSGTVDGGDLGLVLAAWGEICP